MARFNSLAQIVAQNGFTVIPCNEKKPVVRRWQNPNPTDPQWLAKMVANDRYRDCNLGIVCGRVIAIDIDADDPKKVSDLQKLCTEYLGPTMWERVGRAPRTLLLYRPAPGEIIPSFNVGCIDVLSGGRQFVAFGIHPDTGQPYQWIFSDNPATKRIEDVPTITAAQVQLFTAAVARIGVPTITATTRATAAAMIARQRGCQSDMLERDNGIVRDASGRVVDGREKLLRNIIAVEFASDKNTTPEILANRAWARFVAEADLSRPKGSNPRQRWQFKDALAKARSTCRRRPDLKAPRRSRGGHPASNLHAWRKPGFWTAAERDRHHAELGQRIKTPVVVAVARVMLDAVDMATGFCTLSIADIATRASCSAKSVTKARAVLCKSGLWLAGPGGVFVPQALNSNQVIERKGQKAIGGNIKVPRLYHWSAVPHSLPLSPILGSKKYQRDMFAAPVVDLDSERHRRGILPRDVAALVRSEMRARGVTQAVLAAELGISQSQLANALAGRFGLSAEPVARLHAWLLRKAA